MPDDRPPSARYEEFLRGERPEDVLVYLHDEGIESVDDLLKIGARVDDGVALVLPGEEGKNAFQQATGMSAMNFAGMAMKTEGGIDPECTGGTCPNAASKPEEDHYAKFVFAFVEEQNEEVGGLYAQGDVVHGYAACACGLTYSEKRVIEA